MRILFEDAATGARSPALVRQGQIGEIVNAKPEQRRRILEDAAGIAGLHSRRHEAELRLKAAEGNLARLNDILGQLNSQIESLKRQARQARRYKELSAEIRKLDAVVLHLRWTEAQAQVESEEAALADGAGEGRPRHRGRSPRRCRAEAETAAQLQPLRDQEAAKGAVLHRFKIEQDNLEREAQRTADRQPRAGGPRRAAQARPGARGDADRRGQGDAGSASRARSPRSPTPARWRRTSSRRRWPPTTRPETALKARRGPPQRAHHRGGRGARAPAEPGTRRRASAGSRSHKLERQLVGLEAQTREIVGRAPDASKLKAATELGQQLMAEIASIEAQTVAAEEAVQAASAEVRAKSAAAAETGLAAGQLKTEVETLAKLLTPAGDSGLPPILDAIKVAGGLRDGAGRGAGRRPRCAGRAGGARALAPECGAGARSRPARRRRAAGRPCRGAARADAPPAPDRRRRRRRRRAPAAPAEARAAAGLARGRSVALGRLRRRRAGVDGCRRRGWPSAAGSARWRARRPRRAARRRGRARRGRGGRRQRLRAAQDEERRLRQLWREAQGKLAQTRDVLTAMERQARETEARIAGRLRRQAATPRRRWPRRTRMLSETEAALQTLAGTEGLEAELAAAQTTTAELRSRVSEGRTELITLEREHRARTERQAAIGLEQERWRTRSAGADQQIATLKERIAEAEAEIAKLAEIPAMVEQQRQKLMSELAKAEQERARGRRCAGRRRHRPPPGRPGPARGAGVPCPTRARRARAPRRGSRARARAAPRRPAASATSSAARPTAAWRWPSCSRAPSCRRWSMPTASSRASRPTASASAASTCRPTRTSPPSPSSSTGWTRRRPTSRRPSPSCAPASARSTARPAAACRAPSTPSTSHFQRLFTTLFGGGEARLEMIEAEDPLEGGLEIIAKPPGKKPATLSLLSGGEQSLTAQALIFAVFLTNPSPICVLDEVDAPLDDANVDRFCTLMEKMAAETATRFLVITHHPMTMARMNRLFGVTMGEKGVSQLVSVDLETAQKFTVAA